MRMYIEQMKKAGDPRMRKQALEMEQLYKEHPFWDTQPVIKSELFDYTTREVTKYYLILIGRSNREKESERHQLGATCHS